MIKKGTRLHAEDSDESGSFDKNSLMEQRVIVMRKNKRTARTAALLFSVVLMLVSVTSCFKKGEDSVEYPVTEKPTYMIYYGLVDENVVEHAKQYDIVILHPNQGGLTAKQVDAIQSTGTKVLAYLAVGEDLRTSGKTPEEMREDPRFTGDGSGPRVDPRAEGDNTLENAVVSGSDSPGGSGFASYYLDDNDHDGLPDINPYFFCAYTNIGDPNWYQVLDTMTVDGEDGVAGIREILTEEYGRGLGCDGLFLDTIDTCAPNAYTDDDNPARTRFEWTAVGVSELMARIKADYPGTLICQNRGLFFYNHLLEHYRYNPRANVDYLFFESYRLDSNPEQLYNEGFFADNKYNLVPRLAVESRCGEGFTVLSLGYAEGPEEYDLLNTLIGKSKKGLEVLRQDVEEADELAGFSHYITNAPLTQLNDFVMINRNPEDDKAPVWSSVYNNSSEWPPHEPEARVGLGEVKSEESRCVTVTWDVALDQTGVCYTLYYQQGAFDFDADPDLIKAKKVLLNPTITEDYQKGVTDAYPYCATVDAMESGKEYSFVLRATDTSPQHNEEKNTVVKTAVIQ